MLLCIILLPARFIQISEFGIYLLVLGLNNHSAIIMLEMTFFSKENPKLCYSSNEITYTYTSDCMKCS